MEIKLHIKPSFKTVFIANGVFYENMNSFLYRSDDVLYLTVFPLDALYLPYTIKMVGGVALNNEYLVKTYKLPDSHTVVKLQKRYNIAYAHERRDTETPTGTVKCFFDEVKCGNLIKAREFLTDGLNKSINDSNLTAFFDGYTDIVENEGYVSSPYVFFLIDKNNSGVPFVFTEIDDKIDNISDI